MTLTPAPDARPADWILAEVRSFDHTVGSIVPPVFDAYARVFHPALRGQGDEQAAVRWADVAQATGRQMHPAAEWGSITGSWKSQYDLTQPQVCDCPPSTGQLPAALAERLAAILSRYSEDPGSGYFGVWEGWGISTAMFLFTKDTPEGARRRAREAHDAEVATWRELIESAATFEVPHRRMHLLHGPLLAIKDFYDRHDGRSGLCVREPPSLWWPADARWCVGTDIDLMTTYVGASSAALEALLADDQLEVLLVPDTQSVTWQADTINPLPDPP
ncbi:MAG TPA: hypothetical protein VGF15_01650 [Solirubrobacteraceae bacterium]